jgi:hypothetical protein
MRISKHVESIWVFSIFVGIDILSILFGLQYANDVCTVSGNDWRYFVSDGATGVLFD